MDVEEEEEEEGVAEDGKPSEMDKSDGDSGFSTSN